MNAALDAILAKVKPGDEVTATFQRDDERQTYTVSGTVWLTALRSLAVGNEIVSFLGGQPGTGLNDVVIKKPAPDPEPPIGSVVLDDDGDAWQSPRGGTDQPRQWWCVGIGTPRSWERLTDVFGPLRVIYTPEVTP